MDYYDEKQQNREEMNQWVAWATVIGGAICFIILLVQYLVEALK
jgi:hypothetical protein